MKQGLKHTSVHLPHYFSYQTLTQPPPHRVTFETGYQFITSALRTHSEALPPVAHLHTAVAQMHQQAAATRLESSGMCSLPSRLALRRCSNVLLVITPSFGFFQTIPSTDSAYLAHGVGSRLERVVRTHPCARDVAIYHILNL